MGTCSPRESKKDKKIKWVQWASTDKKTNVNFFYNWDELENMPYCQIWVQYKYGWRKLTLTEMKRPGFTLLLLITV